MSTTGKSRARSAIRRPPPRRTVQARRSPWPRRLIGLALVAAIAGVGYLIVREPFGEAVRDVTLPLRHEDVIRQQAREKGLDPALIAAIIYEETRFRPRTSSAGAEGLMQIVPETAQFIADRSGGTQFELRDLGTPQINIQYGSFYLRYLLQQYAGDEDLAVAAYNGGETNLNDWIAAAGGLEAFDVGDDIPFPETREYVENVAERRDEYAKHYRKELGL
ncbi:MAG: lytic transglycosylase domain-containing protein [Thermoleophilaceae bacterium]|nr:lytic transglycosylase domain-containing protein [Thermoleophilaceae bacterium]